MADPVTGLDAFGTFTREGNAGVHAEEDLIAAQAEMAAAARKKAARGPSQTEVRRRAKDIAEHTAKTAADAEAPKRAIEINKITKYASRFKKRISTPIPRNLENYGLSRLVTLRKGIEHDLGSFSASNGIFRMLEGMAQTVESFSTPEWPLDGPFYSLTESLKAREDEFTTTCDELVIKHGHYLAMSVEMRMVVLLANAVRETVAINKEGLAREAENGPRVPPEMEDAYEDL